MEKFAILIAPTTVTPFLLGLPKKDVYHAQAPILRLLFLQTPSVSSLALQDNMLTSLILPA
jgi:hypothetical protein